MTEFARALVLPDLGLPSRDAILSLLLVWDGLELEIAQVAREDGDVPLWVLELEQAGMLRVTKRPFDAHHPPESRRPFDEEWQGLAELLDVFGPILEPDKAVGTAAQAITDSIVENVRRALDRASREGLAPIAATYHASLAASLPREDAEAPVREATLIDVATRGIRVAPETSVEEVIAFREANSAAIGRFRASLIDMAASIGAESPAAAEEAFALVRNRVEPALAALGEVLSRGRISFGWSMLFGASTTVAAGIDTGAAVAEAGQVVTRGLRYAFNRERLIRDHPYGFLYRARRDFDAIDARPANVITDPQQEITNSFRAVVGAAVEATVKAAAEGQIDSTQLRRVLDEQSPGLGQLDFGKADGG